MAKNEEENPVEGEQIVEQTAQEQTGRTQVRLRVDERGLNTAYANAFRSNATAEEVIIDFGLNLVVQGPQQQQQQQQQQQEGQQQQAEILFQANNRIIMNYYSAKRLAITLGQLIRRHEEQFGELKLNASERVSG